MPVRYIALCGNPKSGKSTVQKILHDRYGVLPVDDGLCLRDFAMRHLGLTLLDVSTQEGKTRHTNILGKSWENRKILGEFGAALENLFGEHIMPWVATRGLNGNGVYSFGSVRKTQGHFFKEQFGREAVIVEVMRKGVGPTGNAFDAYDRSMVDMVIDNSGTVEELAAVIGMFFDGKFESRPVAFDVA
jgi:hypothetical protein